ncbi:tetratricopeptide repeat protein [Clostridium sp.]|uniref:tetratricopeptide repeat protein n=1 Tax=Clostridium sp. TaxID=1506 RepID=UPI002FCB984B
MEKTKKYYAKAMDYYCEGNIEKALEYCEKSLGIKKDYSPALNLKGLIHYVKGNLEQAQMDWRINYKLNNDEISKKYLDDSKKDKETLELFAQGLNYYKEIKIHQALECFKQCEKSHFNVINLWNYMAYCYMKLGKYENCKYYIQEVLKLDKSNKLALGTKKSLMDIGMAKREVNLRNIYKIVPIALLLVFFMVVYFNKDMIKSLNVLDKFSNVGFSLNNKNKDSNDVELNNSEKENSPKAEEKPIKDNDESKIEDIIFDFEAVKEDLDNKNYEKLIEYLEVYNKDNLSLNEKALLGKIEEEIKNQGVKYFYDNAMSYIKSDDFSQGLNYLNKIYKYSGESYLREHITYIMGFAYEKKFDVENANKYYEIYVNEFSDGSYVDVSLYNLAILNENIDLEKSKKYALILSRDYSDSQYNNSKISSIMKR